MGTFLILYREFLASNNFVQMDKIVQLLEVCKIRIWSAFFQLSRTQNGFGKLLAALSKLNPLSDVDRMSAPKHFSDTLLIEELRGFPPPLEPGSAAAAWYLSTGSCVSPGCARVFEVCFRPLLWCRFDILTFFIESVFTSIWISLLCDKGLVNLYCSSIFHFRLVFLLAFSQRFSTSTPCRCALDDDDHSSARNSEQFCRGCLLRLESLDCSRAQVLQQWLEEGFMDSLFVSLCCQCPRGKSSRLES